MKKTPSSTNKTEKTKAAAKLTDLKPKQNPKGGRTVRTDGGCDDWGCGANHNETFLCDSSR